MTDCPECRARRRPCVHPPALVVDEDTGAQVLRTCLACGLTYDRGETLTDLRGEIRERHRLPSSPWSAEERAADLALTVPGLVRLERQVVAAVSEAQARCKHARADEVREVRATTYVLRCGLCCKVRGGGVLRG